MDNLTIEKIKDAADIVDVVGEFLTLKKKGTRYSALCPFHGDRHEGNFVVYPAGNCYKCFACGAKGGPVDFVMQYEGKSFAEAIRWLGQRYGILDGDTHYTPPPPRPAIPQLPTLHLPQHLVGRSADVSGDPLVAWLRSLPWDGAQRRRLEESLTAYHIGHSRQGMTIYWQIDEECHVRTAKMMLYAADGHRDRTTAYNFDWIHSLLSRRRDEHGKIISTGPYPYPHLFDPDKQEMRQCLFGLHLLNQYKVPGIAQAVHIVESEKTALIMATAYGNNPKQVWLATGGMENLTREKLAPVIAQGRDIVFYPDRDGVDKWRKKVAALDYARAKIDTTPVLKWWREGDGDKADIADVVLRMIRSRKIYTSVEEVCGAIPALKKLHDKYNLDIADDNGRQP